MTAFLVFAAIAIVALYVIAGYPALLWLRTRGRSRTSIPPNPAAELPSVSVVLPVRDGAKWIAAKLQTLRNLDYPRDLVQIIVISDGSTDETESIVRDHPAGAVLLSNEGSGKAAALNTGLTVATGDVLFFTDVRQPLDPSALRWLVAQFEDPAVGVATGELMIISEDGTPTTKAGLYWRYEKWIRKLHSGIDSVLGATGAIYAMRRHLARPLPTGTLLDDMLMPLRAFLDGYRIVFVPEARAYDTQADLRGEFRRKVRTQAGVYQLISLCPELFGFRNRMLFDFLSHKIGRLVSPWILLAMLVAAWFLPWPLPLIVTAGACVPVVLGLADPFIGGPALLKKVSAAARTFLVLMWAATCAVSILFVPAESLWKPGAQNDTQRA